MNCDFALMNPYNRIANDIDDPSCLDKRELLSYKKEEPPTITEAKKL